ncbi:MAG: ABC transporter permease [Legionella sp.]|nr:ABC transporter permease [Legionella sp.]
MTLTNHFQQAWVNLCAAKLRSFLAVLGILVGTAAVVALISSGQMATAKALEQFKALGTDLLAVSVFQKTPSKSHSESDSLTVEQWLQMGEIPKVIQIAPYAIAYQSLSYEGTILQGAIIGADESLADIIHITLARGHFVSYLSSFEHECVIGNELANQLKEVTLDDPIGKQLRIGKYLYTIIGIASPWKENGFFNENINRSVIVPLRGLSLLNADTKISNAVMKLQQDSSINAIIDEITTYIQSKSPTLSLFPRSAKQIIASMESQGRIFTLLLAVIGSISLLVGGIGVMNVMLVSVSERKKEIGIRKAVGAKNSEIQALFLVESILLSLVGGLLGVIIGLVFTCIIAYFNSWNFSINLLPSLAGFIVSAATGIFFGFYPAFKAAQLEPMVSLRSE